MDFIMAINDKVNAFVWGPIMLALLVGTGVYLSVRVGFIQVGKFGLHVEEYDRYFVCGETQR